MVYCKQKSTGGIFYHYFTMLEVSYFHDLSAPHFLYVYDLRNICFPMYFSWRCLNARVSNSLTWELNHAKKCSTFSTKWSKLDSELWGLLMIADTAIKADALVFFVAPSVVTYSSYTFKLSREVVSFAGRRNFLRTRSGFSSVARNGAERFSVTLL